MFSCLSVKNYRKCILLSISQQHFSTSISRYLFCCAVMLLLLGRPACLPQVPRTRPVGSPTHAARQGPQQPPSCHRPGRSHYRHLPGSSQPLLLLAPRHTRGQAGNGEPERYDSPRGARGRSDVGRRPGLGVIPGGGRGRGPGRAGPGPAGATHPHPGRKGWWRRAASRGEGERRCHPSRQRGGGERSSRLRQRLLLQLEVPPPLSPPPRAGEPVPRAQHAGKPGRSRCRRRPGPGTRRRLQPPACPGARTGGREGPGGPLRRSPRLERCLALAALGRCGDWRPAWPGLAWCLAP